MGTNRLFCLLLVPFLAAIGSGQKAGSTETALHETAKNGDLEQVKGLIESGHDIHARDDHGRTALHHAVVTGHTDMVELLIAKGANIKAKDNYGVTPLVQLIDVLFLMEAENGYVEILKMLITNGANVREKGEFDATALHWAAHAADKDIAELVIAEGAEINAKDIDGQTPLHMASGDGSLDLVELLVTSGADVNAQDEQARMPLHRAALFGRGDVVKLLVDSGANITAKGMYGHTPLHGAAWHGHTDIVEFLAAKGADIHSLDKDKQTALHLAAEYGGKDVAEFLIAKGADVSAKNSYGATPLGLAVGGRRSRRRLPEAKDSDSYCVRAHYFYWQYEFERAIEDFSSAIRLDPQNDRAYYWRGRAWARKEDPQQTIADWKKAIGLSWRNALHVYHARHLLKSSNAELDRMIRDTAVEHLADLEEVSGYAVWYSAEPGEFYTCSLILSTPFEEDMFLEMVRHDNPVIRALGLICLAREDTSRYESTIRSFYTDTAEVDYVPFGCVVTSITLNELAASIIDDPNLLDYWSAEHTEPGPSTSDRDSTDADWIRRRFEVVQLLLSKGADVNTKDVNGKTPLHYAAEHGNARFARLLIANGAEVNARNHYSETPLCTAVIWGYKDMVELLIASDADVNVNARGGRTPLRIAIDMDYHALSDLLREKGAQE